MNYLKKICKSLIYTLIALLIFTFILTLLNYFNIISDSLFNIIELISIIISFFIGGMITGKNSNNKGYLEGLKISIIFIIIIYIINLIITGKYFNIKNILYYLIIIASTTFGSVIGINKKITN